MTQFAQDAVAIQDAEARGTRFGYRRPGIPGRPALVFCQHFMGTVDDHVPALSGAFASDREVILFNAGQRGRTAMTRLNVDDARCEALFASGLQRSDAPTAASVAEAIGWAVRRFGTRGCAGRMAQEFGDHPQAAAERMRWVRQLAARTAARHRMTDQETESGDERDV